MINVLLRIIPGIGLGIGFVIEILLLLGIIPVKFVFDSSYLSTIFSASITLAGFGITIISLLPNSFDKTYYGYKIKEIIHMKESGVSINTFIKVTFWSLILCLFSFVLCLYNVITASFIFLLLVTFNYFRNIFKIITNDLECDHIVTAYIKKQSSKTDNSSIKDNINTHLLHYLSVLSSTSSPEKKDKVWNLFWDSNKEIWLNPPEKAQITEQEVNKCSDFTNKIVKLYIPAVDSSLFASYFRSVLSDNALSTDNKKTLIEHGLSSIKNTDYITLTSVGIPSQIRKLSLENKSYWGIDVLYWIYIKNILNHPKFSKNEKINLISELFTVIAQATIIIPNSINEPSETEKNILYNTVRYYIFEYSDMENAKILLSCFVSFVARVKTSHSMHDIVDEIAKLYATAVHALFIPQNFHGIDSCLIQNITTFDQKRNLYNLLSETSYNGTHFFDLLYDIRFGSKILKTMTTWLSPSFSIPTHSEWHDDIFTHHSKNTAAWAYIHMILYLLEDYIHKSSYRENVLLETSIFDTYENWDNLSNLDGRNYKPIILNLYSVFQITDKISFKKDFFEILKKLLNISVPKYTIKEKFIIHAFETINAEKAKYYTTPWISESFNSTADDWLPFIDSFQFDVNVDHLLANEVEEKIYFTSLVYYPTPISRKEIIQYIFRKSLSAIRSYLDDELEATSNINEVKHNCHKLSITHCSFEMSDIMHGTNDATITDKFRKDVSPLLDRFQKVDFEKWNGFYFFNKEFMKFYFFTKVNVVQTITEAEIKEKINQLPRFGNKYIYETNFFSVLLSYEEVMQAIKNEHTEYHATYTVKTSIDKENSFRIDAIRANFFLRY